MKKWNHRPNKSFVAGLGTIILGVGAMALVGFFSPTTQQCAQGCHHPKDMWQRTLEDLTQLDLLSRVSNSDIHEIVDYQIKNDITLASMLRNPVWAEKLGLNSAQFKGTWYAANPFDLLPPGLQQAIHELETPFKKQDQVWKWFKVNKFDENWRNPLKNALIETTPENLWRAARGLRPYAKNGQFLEPIVYEREMGVFDVTHGHIATDPRYIPTNSEVFVIIQVKGEDRILRVKAADVGGAIKGKHVDLPVYLHYERQSLDAPHFVFPSEIRNPTVIVLSPLS